MWDLRRIYNLHHSSRQCRILNPLSKAREQTCILKDTSWVHYHRATMGTPEPVLTYNLMEEMEPDFPCSHCTTMGTPPLNFCLLFVSHYKHLYCSSSLRNQWPMDWIMFSHAIKTKVNIWVKDQILESKTPLRVHIIYRFIKQFTTISSWPKEEVSETFQGSKGK